MARLSKIQSALQIKVQHILQKDVLSNQDVEFVFNNYHECANNNITVSGAFFTPLSLALEFAEYCCCPQVKRPSRILDLCAGIGFLSYTMNNNFDRCDFNEQCEITCGKLNADHIAVAKKLLPQAYWVQVDVTDFDAILTLDDFDLVIGNPSFGDVITFKNKERLCYTGLNAAFSAIEIASLVTRNATFIFPQDVAGFKYRGEKTFTAYRQEKIRTICRTICQQTGIEIMPNKFSGSIDHQPDWKSKVPNVKSAEIDFNQSKVTKYPVYCAPKRNHLFGLLA
jgi:predicted RNA methylase